MTFDRIDMEVLEKDLTAIRRDLHQHAEVGWTEFRTTALILCELRQLGLPVRYGPEIHERSSMYGLPSEEILEDCFQRARREWNEPEVLEPMRGGFTGCVTEIRGTLPGPTIGIRMDIDCNDVQEAMDDGHRPAREGFASLHDGCMHACGHDAHAAIGIGVARILCAYRDRLRGKVVLIFQPAEEGVHGASSMAAAGVAATCDILLGGHVGCMLHELGEVAASSFGFNNATVFDVDYTGRGAHAGMAPQDGRNAMAAAATAVLNMLAIAPHANGFTRANVGVLQSGTNSNTIPASAHMMAEVRGETADIHDYMLEHAKRIFEHAAAMYECEYRFTYVGTTRSIQCDQSLVERVMGVLRQDPDIRKLIPAADMAGGGDDISILMKAVQEHGGQVTEMMFGTPLAAGHHNGRFDIDERVIGIAARALASLALEL